MTSQIQAFAVAAAFVITNHILACRTCQTFVAQAFAFALRVTHAAAALAAAGSRAGHAIIALLALPARIALALLVGACAVDAVLLRAFDVSACRTGVGILADALRVALHIESAFAVSRAAAEIEACARDLPTVLAAPSCVTLALRLTLDHEARSVVRAGQVAQTVLARLAAPSLRALAEGLAGQISHAHSTIVARGHAVIALIACITDPAGHALALAVKAL